MKYLFPSPPLIQVGYYQIRRKIKKTTTKGKTRQGEKIQDETRPRQHQTRQRQDERQGKTREKARQGKARQGEARDLKARDKARQKKSTPAPQTRQSGRATVPKQVIGVTLPRPNIHHRQGFSADHRTQRLQIRSTVFTVADDV